MYNHYRKWCLSDTVKLSCIIFLETHTKELDLLSVDLDRSHTPAIRGAQVEYLGRKKRKTTNIIYLTESLGLASTISEAISGHHNDLYCIEVQFEVVTGTLEEVQISVEGLFLNADAGFD